jgi:hypothetical protein
MHGRAWALLTVVALALLAGCTAPVADGDASDRELTDDRIGYVDGYAHDDPVAVDGSDGLTTAELDAVVPRAMARIERERGLNFRRTVPVEVMTREEYRQQSGQFAGSYDAFDREVLRAAFLVGDDADPREEYEELYGSSVAGYYTSRDGGRIVVVADDPESMRIDRNTLVHELVHALQDQHRSIARQTETRDERLAWQGVVEGEANYLMYRYEERCGDEYDCIEVGGGARETGSVDRESMNMGLFVTVFHPYSDGPSFVAALHDRSGWDAVDRAYEDPPTSTAQITHPGLYPDDPPRNVTVPDRSGDSWERMTNSDGEPRTERIGEASLYAALWRHGVIDRSHPFDAPGEYTTYNYSHPLTDGWAGDVVVAYEDGDRTGHVFKTAWANASEAAEFRDGYERLLDRQNATTVREGVYRVPDDASFPGAYRVTQRGDEVTVVHAPTVDDLEGVQAPRATASRTTDATSAPSRTAASAPA